MPSKIELKYIAYAVIFALTWFLFLLPLLIKNFAESNPFIQFIIFNVGLLILLQIFLKSVTLGTSVKLSESLGLVSTFVALDILQPAYSVLRDGTLISVDSGTLFTSSSDYIAGLIAQSLGLTGILVYLFTYIVVPVLLLLLSAKLLSNFVRTI